MSTDDQAINVLRRIRAAVRAGITPRKRNSRTPRSTSEGRDPRLLGEVVDEFLASSGLDARSRVAQVLTNWADLVGPEVAAHVQVERFDDGKLLLRADSTAWATQVRLLQATVLRRLTEQLGEGIVESIQVLGPDAPSWRFGSRRVPGRGPRDTYG